MNHFMQYNMLLGVARFATGRHEFAVVKVPLYWKLYVPAGQGTRLDGHVPDASRHVLRHPAEVQLPEPLAHRLSRVVVI